MLSVSGIPLASIHHCRAQAVINVPCFPCSWRVLLCCYGCGDYVCPPATQAPRGMGSGEGAAAFSKGSLFPEVGSKLGTICG